MTVVLTRPVGEGGRDVSLGRLAFPTIFDQVKESAGAATVETIGAAVVPGDPRPRPLELSLPVHATTGDGDTRAAGERLRRQVRSMMANSAARLGGCTSRSLRTLI